MTILKFKKNNNLSVA